MIVLIHGICLRLGEPAYFLICFGQEIQHRLDFSIFE